MDKVLSDLFPETIIVNDMTVNLEEFSNYWRENIVHIAEQILTRYKQSHEERFIVAIGGASGSGKSVSSAVLEHLLNKIQSDVKVLSIGQDGYHFRQDYLENTLDGKGEQLSEHKGRYDSFDIDHLKKDLENFKLGAELSFPLYSRKIHNPIPNSISCSSKKTIIILEGLWLLYNEKPWNDLLSLYDFRIFIHASDEIRKNNTINRHIKGHEHSAEEAEKFYNESDLINAQILLASISDRDLDIKY
jgi:pantothenate kinase